MNVLARPLAIIRQKSAEATEKKNRRFEVLGNELENISNVAERTRASLKNVRSQRQQAKAIQDEKELKAKQYLDFLRTKLKRDIKKQHSFRYQQELIHVYHGEEDEKEDNDSNSDGSEKSDSNASNVALPLPYILTKQANLLKCLHLIELHDNQCKMIQDQILKFRESRNQEEQVARSAVIPTDDDIQKHIKNHDVATVIEEKEEQETLSYGESIDDNDDDGESNEAVKETQHDIPHTKLTSLQQITICQPAA